MGDEDWLCRELRGGSAHAKALGWMFKERAEAVFLQWRMRRGQGQEAAGSHPAGHHKPRGFEVTLIAMRSF